MAKKFTAAEVVAAVLESNTVSNEDDGAAQPEGFDLYDKDEYDNERAPSEDEWVYFTLQILGFAESH